MSLFETLYDLLFPPAESDLPEEPPVKEIIDEPGVHNGLSISVYEPENLSLAKKIIIFMSEENHAAFVKLCRLSEKEKIRMSDLICGAAIALGNEVRRIDADVILCSAKPFVHEPDPVKT